MPKIAAGGNATVSIPAGSTISVATSGGWLRFEFPTGTRLFEGSASQKTFGPFGSTANATITSMIGAVDYAIATPPSPTHGFYGATPVVQPTGTPANATDLATAITLANSLKASLIALGLIS